MSETRELVAILVADVVGYCRLACADEDRTLAWLRALRSDLIDPTIAVHHGRIVFAGIIPLWWPATCEAVQGQRHRCSDCCFEDRTNGLSNVLQRHLFHPAGIGSNISLVCSPATGKMGPASAARG